MWSWICFLSSAAFASIAVVWDHTKDPGIQDVPIDLHTEDLAAWDQEFYRQTGKIPFYDQQCAQLQNLMAQRSGLIPAPGLRKALESLYTNPNLYASNSQGFSLWHDQAAGQATATNQGFRIPGSNGGNAR